MLPTQKMPVNLTKIGPLLPVIAKIKVAYFFLRRCIFSNRENVLNSVQISSSQLYLFSDIVGIREMMMKVWYRKS